MPTRKPTRRTSAKAAPPTKPGFSLYAVLSGLGFALIFALVAFLGWSLLFTLTSLPDQYMTYAAYGTSFIAVFLGGRLAARRAGGGGLLNGGVVGVGYALLLGALAGLTTSTPLGFSMKDLIRPLVDVVAGVLGGIMGNNGR